MLTSKEFCYKRTVQYHETDAMRIMHHANYIKWMEEARYAFLQYLGVPWSNIEQEKGITIPVLSVSVEYKQALRFEDEIALCCRLVKFNGVKMEFEYEFRNSDGKICAIGKSSHGFLNRDFKPVALQSECAKCYKILIECYRNTERYLHI